jgi:hypothetical protein
MNPTLPLVDESHHEDEQEDAHGDQAEDADALEHHRPRKQECDLEIEHDEQDRDQVVPHVEFHAAVFEGLEAALVRRELLCVAARLGTQAPNDEAKAHEQQRQARGNREENQYRQVIRKHFWMFRPSRKGGETSRTRETTAPQKFGRDCIRDIESDGADGETRTPTDRSASPSS